MNAITTHEERLSKMTLKAAVIYDDFDFAARAAALLERVAIRADEAMKWDVKPWRLDVLKEPSLAADALDETTDADLIVVAFRKTPSLPDELMGWLESWAIKRQTEDTAMMVFCPEGNAALTLLWHELKKFAGWHNLLFLGSHNLRDDGNSMEYVHRLWQRKQPPQPVVPTLESFAESPHPSGHWGINE
jgi:hypothetical protein